MIIIEGVSERLARIQPLVEPQDNARTDDPVDSRVTQTSEKLRE
jgi:hypothetical protein